MFHMFVYDSLNNDLLSISHKNSSNFVYIRRNYYCSFMHVIHPPSSGFGDRIQPLCHLNFCLI